MVVLPQELTIPSHEKTFRLITVLKQKRRPELVTDFQPLAFDQWIGIHDRSYVRSVAEADADTFYAASIPLSNCMVAAIELSAASMVAAPMIFIGFIIIGLVIPGLYLRTSRVFRAN